MTVNNYEPTEITFKASEARYPYIESKQIHNTQELKDAAQRIFTIKVIPNRELDSLILSYGADLEVISPEWYRNHIKKKIIEANEVYSGRQQDYTPESYLCNVKSNKL